MQSVEHDLKNYPWTIGRKGDRKMLLHVPTSTYFEHIAPISWLPEELNNKGATVENVGRMDKALGEMWEAAARG